MPNPLSGLFRSRTIQRLLANKGLTRSSAIVAIVFLVWFIPTALYESPKRPKIRLSPEEQAIDRSIKAAHAKTDPFLREHFMQQEAKRLNLTSDEYRKLFAIRKPDSEVLPDTPTGFFQKIPWFYQELSRRQRLKLIGNGFVSILKLLPNLTILFVGGRFLLEIPQREKQAKYQAWRIVHEAHNQKISGSRVSALEDLQEHGESLAGLTLKAAELKGISLEKADLHNANFSNANLSFAKLSGANLSFAKLSGANLSFAELNGANLSNAKLNGANLGFTELSGANLNGAILSNAKLNGIKLIGADLSGAILTNAALSGIELSRTNLSNTDLNNANLSNANLSDAKLNGAKLNGANLSGAILVGTNFGSTALSDATLAGANLNIANLSGTNLSGANLSDAILTYAENWTEEQIFQTKLCNTKLPVGLDIDRNRDCEKLGLSRPHPQESNE